MCIVERCHDCHEHRRTPLSLADRYMSLERTKHKEEKYELYFAKATSEAVDKSM